MPSRPSATTDIPRRRLFVPHSVSLIDKRQTFPMGMPLRTSRPTRAHASLALPPPVTKTIGQFFQGRSAATTGGGLVHSKAFGPTQSVAPVSSASPHPGLSDGQAPLRLSSLAHSSDYNEAVHWTGSSQDGDPWEEPDGQAAPQEAANRPGVKNPSSSPRTGKLHLDGATLGRWTTDHLTRSLAGSPTGMTGIDPRVSAPRSRLSPF